MIKEGNIIDIPNKRIYKGRIKVEGGKITSIEELNTISADSYILPGFIDSHIHIESSMLPPSEFARHAVKHGTVATISDPHEIANVNGVEGVHFMIEDGKRVPFKFHFGAPSCVPATMFETAGAIIGVAEVEELMKNPDIWYLAEVMNYPGVINNDPDMLGKITASKKNNKPIDGHAPGLRGAQAERYFSHSITTDHECFTYEEALDKLKLGVNILIREGSAAKNFEALIPLLDQHYEQMMFCSDDLHPNDLLVGHINLLVKRALAKGIDLFKVLQSACINPVLHYKIPVGMLRPGDPADFIVIDDTKQFNILETYINGDAVYINNASTIKPLPIQPINNFNCSTITTQDISIHPETDKIKVIEVHEGQLVTSTGYAEFPPSGDVLKIVVVNRYATAKPAVAFVRNFGLTKGALASSIAHDSHNIIATGTNDEDIVNAINLIINQTGGISACNTKQSHVLPLAIAGLMSTLPGAETARRYEELDAIVKSWGCKLNAPYMTLSFLALLVIPELKLSDKGLFDGGKFEFTSVFC